MPPELCPFANCLPKLPFILPFTARVSLQLQFGPPWARSGQIQQEGDVGSPHVPFCCNCGCCISAFNVSMIKDNHTQAVMKRKFQSCTGWERSFVRTDEYEA